MASLGSQEYIYGGSASRRGVSRVKEEGRGITKTKAQIPKQAQNSKSKKAATSGLDFGLWI